MERFDEDGIFKMRSESSECTWNAKAILIHPGELAGRMCRGSLGEKSDEIRKLMEMILMVFREQSKEDDQMNTVRKPVMLIPETLRKWELTLKERGRFWEWQPGKYSLKTRCWSRAQIRANGDWSSWGAHRGDRWSRNKEGCVLLRNRRGLMEHIQKVFMRLSQYEIQTKCTVALQKTSL